MLRQDKSIGAFVLCNVRLHLEPREGREGGEVDDEIVISKQGLDINTTTFFLVYNTGDSGDFVIRRGVRNSLP